MLPKLLPGPQKLLPQLSATKPPHPARYTPPTTQWMPFLLTLRSWKPGPLQMLSQKVKHNHGCALLHQQHKGGLLSESRAAGSYLGQSYPKPELQRSLRNATICSPAGREGQAEESGYTTNTNPQHPPPPEHRSFPFAAIPSTSQLYSLI